MRNKIVKLGRSKIVGIITLISIAISILVYMVIGYLIEGNIAITGILIAIIVSLIMAPLISWYMIGLLIKVHYLEIEMRTLATYDSLTKVLARKAFLTNAQNIYQIHQREKNILSILYIDIDDFKNINDTYGHKIGDDVLKSFGKILQDNKRESDIVGRLGGEEFAYILPSTNNDGAEQFSNNLRKIVNSQTIQLNNIDLTYSISIGVSVLNNNTIDLETLIHQADEALYIAKHSGKDCTIIYKHESKKR